MKKFLWSVFLLKFLVIECASQSIELKSVEFFDNKIVLNYNLNDSVVGRYFTIRLYSSNDNFFNPLEKLTGDIGFEVKPGPNKKLIWDAKEELGETFDGRVSLEIRARIFVPFINVDQISNYKVFKRKREYNLTWSGGKPTNVLNFDLFRNNQKVATFPNIANVGHHTFVFPAHVKPGKGYHFKVSDAKNKDEVVNSQSFRIKRKVPLLAKAVALGAVGVGVYSLLNSSPSNQTLPGAPLPDGN